MIVSELVEQLLVLDQNIPVVVKGFDEFGYDEVQEIKVIGMSRAKFVANYDDGEDITAVFLAR